MYNVDMALSNPVTKKTRSKDNVWLIGYPSETISGARLPSGRDAMRNFVYFCDQRNCLFRKVHWKFITILYHSGKNHACPYVRNSILSGRLKTYIMSMMRCWRILKEIARETSWIKKTTSRNSTHYSISAIHILKSWSRTKRICNFWSCNKNLGPDPLGLLTLNLLGRRSVQSNARSASRGEHQCFRLPSRQYQLLRHSQQ